jgi:hypothetical protein
MYYLIEFKERFLVINEQEFKQHWSYMDVEVIKTSFNENELEELSRKIVII